MVLRRTLSCRLLHICNFSTQHLHSAPVLPRRNLPELPKILSAHRRISHSAAIFDGTPSPPNARFPIGNDLMKRIRSSLSRDRIHPIPPFASPRSVTEMEEDAAIETNKIKISVQDARKLIQCSRIEKARAKLRAIPKAFISYSDFIQICREIDGGSDDVATALDKSGAIVVIGDVVFLRPEHLAQAIEIAIDPETISNPRRSELKQMEAEKTIIDRKAEAQVRRELWAGLGFAIFQTAAFMRLTFWEFSWDVMEPVCFFTTSIYFMMGWVFFLRTSKEPSFEGFVAGRCAVKQRRLMKARNFDLSRFNELRTESCNECCGCQRHHQRADVAHLGAAH